MSSYLLDTTLEQPVQVVHKDREEPKQASLTAVSTAYYALFHLLIDESFSNWNETTLRSTLGRAFDHGSMKSGSNRISDSRIFPFTGEDPEVISKLKLVAATFVQLQDKRHVADYDNATFWTRTEALLQVKSAEQAFTILRSIRREPVTQAYLVSLLVKHRS
jgi:hypothetical protein